MTIIEYLEQAERTYNRNTDLRIYEGYKEQMRLNPNRSGCLPRVTDELAEQWGIPAHLRDKLQTEVYIAIEQETHERKQQRQRDMETKGYRLARDTEVSEGERYALVRYSDGLFSAGLQPEERVRVVLDADGRTCLMPLRNKRRGYSIAGSKEFYIKPLS